MPKTQKHKRSMYEKMADAISFMRTHADISNAEIAQAVGMSTSRFEHVFTQWVGTTPKRFRAHLQKEEAKKNIRSTKETTRSAYRSGLKSPARMRELLITYDAVSPGEYAKGEIEIRWGIHDSPFGNMLIGVTKRGIAQIAFLDKPTTKAALAMLKEKWPEATLEYDQRATASYARAVYTTKDPTKPLHLLIKGTNFQIQVWEALLRIPEGQTTTYAAIAQTIKKSGAVRAVGTACGKNAIALLIPCHRVLASDGGMGGYRWGVERKERLLLHEMSM